MIGTSLGPYKIIEQLGAGGMGEVYLGEDTRLGRKVAIKVLPEEYASDPERLARFEQEARAAAALNHPHIAAVFDVGTEGDIHFIVQEYLEGQSLRERLEKGALPLDKALDLATEVGEALIAAHKAGIIHRDLKPDNIFVTEEGHAKVLDFGLAKLIRVAAPAGPVLSHSPTTLGTVAGQIMGTAGYMAPEQVNGEEVDHRADLFAFGCVLYEIVTGRRAFAGDSVVQTLSKIAHEEPEPLSETVTTSPVELQRIVRKCLAKLPARRYQHADDVTVDLRQLQDDLAAGVTQGAAAAASPPSETWGASFSWKVATPAALALLVFGYFAGFAFSGSDPAPAPGPTAEPTRFAIRVDGGHTMSNGYYTQLALSPDGRTLVFAANNLLWSRAFGEEVAIPLEGTDGGEQPFFSPRGDWIGFLQGGRLMRQRMADGSVTQLVEPSVGNINAGSWGADDSIILGMLTSGLGRIPVGGSDIETLATPIAEEGETAYVLPQSIDDGRAVLYTALGPSFLAKDAKVAVLDLTTGDRTVVVERATHGRYAPSGHVVYVDGAGTLMAVPFDLERRESSPADAEPVETGIRVGFWAGAASFDVSAAGTLAFVRGSNWENQLLAVVDRDGNVLRHIGPPLTTDTVTLSRDGSTIAADVFHPDNADIYTYDVDTGNEVRFTEHDAMEENGIVSPNGDRVAFFRTSAGSLGQILVQETGRGAQPEVVYEGSGYATPAVWSPDGEYLMIVGLDALAMSDVLAVNVGTKEVIEIATTDANETPGDFSPDGSYFAYDADDDVRVTPFPSLEGDFVVPDAAQPRWAGDELFFLRDSTLMAMRITTDPSFRPLGDPQPLFELQTIPGSWTGSGRRASISPFPDGQRFLVDVTNPDTKARADEIWVILNWFEELKRLVPTDGR